MKYFLTLLTLLFCIGDVLSQSTLPLMPYPELVNPIDGKYRLSPQFEIGFQNGSPRVYSYATRVLRRLDGRTGLFFSQDQLSENDRNDNSDLFIRITRRGELKVNEDESYQLEINSEGILIESETDLGAIRALETFLQLLSADEEGYYFPYISIEDNPRFPWRGLLIDVCRHWLPMDVIKRNLDAMAAMKMNVLHLHLTEDQGFRIESKVYPRLHELGSNGNYYTQKQMKEIIEYAAKRGIRVVPEFDMPGHTTSWFVGYPELASGPGPYSIETGYGVKDPTIDPTKESTYEFLDNFLGEMAGLFPDEYIHIGGDENNGKQWDANQRIQQFMQTNGIEDNHELQTYFNERVLEILQKYGKKMMGWDEILQPGVPKDIMIQSWRGKESLYDAARDGYNSILSNGYYIDLSWSAERHYLNDPLPADNPLSSGESKRILGGEATMWSEVVTNETVDSRIWPRTAAIAERLWSPEYIDDVESMYSRMEIVSIQLEELGLKHITYQDRMLRRLSRSEDIEALKIFIGTIEPLENYQRHAQGKKLSTYAPFTRLADAALPESLEARKFNLKVDRYIESKDQVLEDELKDQLLIWVENHEAFVEVAARSPVLRDAETLSKDLNSVAIIGIQAMSEMVQHTEEWKKNAYIVLDAVKKPRMECELVILDGIRKLVEDAK